MYNRSKDLLESCFQTYKMEKIITLDDVFEVKTSNKVLKGRTDKEFSYPLSEGELEHLKITTEYAEYNEKLKKSNKIIGQIKIYLSKRLIFSENLYTL